MCHLSNRSHRHQPTGAHLWHTGSSSIQRSQSPIPGLGEEYLQMGKQVNLSEPSQPCLLSSPSPRLQQQRRMCLCPRERQGVSPLCTQGHPGHPHPSCHGQVTLCHTQPRCCYASLFLALDRADINLSQLGEAAWVQCPVGVTVGHSGSTGQCQTGQPWFGPLSLQNTPDPTLEGGRQGLSVPLTS